MTAAKTGVWGLTLRRENADTSAVLAELGSAVAIDRLATIPGVEETYFDVLVLVDADESGNGEICLELAPAQLRQLARSDIPVRITMATVTP